MLSKSENFGFHNNSLLAFSDKEISTGGSPGLLSDFNILISLPVTFFAVSLLP